MPRTERSMAKTRTKAAKKVKAAPKPSHAKKADEESPSAKIEKGDIVWIDYEGWILNPDGNRTLFDTTREELAKKEDKYDEKKMYAEFPIVVGNGRVLPGLDEALLVAEIGKDLELTIPPEKGAGERDPKLVELHPMREFQRQEIDPHLGMEVSLSGRRGTITPVTGGRVRVDFNNPLAGRTLLYRYTVTKKASGTEERLRAILEMDYGLPERFQITIDHGTANIVVPDVCKTDERWFVSKFRVVADFRDFLGLEKIRFVEEYTKPAPAKAPTKAEAKASEKIAEEAPPLPPPTEELAEEELPPDEKSPEEL